MSLLNKIKHEIENHKIISFDIFDTLLLRPYVKPTDLFLHIENQYKLTDFHEKRIHAELVARSKQKHISEEITLDEIYDELSEYSSFKKIELDIELQTLQPNNHIKEVFSYAQSIGKKIIIVSDMYLPESFLNKVLHQKGYNGYYKLYVSSSYRKQKHSGSLFRAIIEDLKYPPSEIYHIGDNKVSDFLMPKKNGFHAFLYTKPIDIFFEKNNRATILYNRNPQNLEVSILLGTLSVNTSQYLTDNIDYWESIGYSYAGPIIYAYVKWLIKKVKTDNIDEVLFLGRDGYTLQKVFNLLTNKELPTHYFYAPRYLKYIFNIGNIDDPNKENLKKLINTLIDSNILPYNFEITESNNTTTKKDNLDLLYNQLVKLKLDYKSYIDNFKITGDNIALIDSYSINLSAQNVITNILKDKTIKGYYWFIDKSKATDNKNFKINTFQTIKQQFISWDLMEFFMSAPTPPILKIENTSPIFKIKNKYESERNMVYPYISDGAINFSKQIENIFGKYIIDLSEKNVTEWINIFSETLTKEDSRHFSNIYHAPDILHNNWRAIFNESNIQDSVKKVCFLGFPLLKIVTHKRKITYLLFFKLPIVRTKKHDTGKLTISLLGIPLIEIVPYKKYRIFYILKLFPVISICDI